MLLKDFSENIKQPGVILKLMLDYEEDREKINFKALEKLKIFARNC